MKITFLGTCSGTEPMAGRRHCSFVIEYDAGVYWFDAGESCSYTAHLAGIDLLLTRAVFISHTHIDHIGGLPNLLFNLIKINTRAEHPSQRLSGKTIKIFIPDLDAWDGVVKVLRPTRDVCAADFTIQAMSVQDGVIYDEHGLKVIALHNHHLGQPQDGRPWKSFSFRIEAEGKSVVFSGDVASVQDVHSLLDHCDLFLMETGHHTVEDVCRHVKDADKQVGRLGFIHHGRAILADPTGELNKARAILGDNIFLTDDGMALDL